VAALESNERYFKPVELGRGVLRTSTGPTLKLFLLLRASV
jgi:hypothetical protein